MAGNRGQLGSGRWAIPESLNCGDDIGCGLAPVAKAGRPFTPRVQRVPSGAALVPAPGAWVVIAKSIDNYVPYWLILRDQHLFR